MTRKTLYKIMLLSGVAITLAGCGGGSGGGATVVLPQARLEDSFGPQFGVDYRANPNSEPVKPVQGDIVPLTLTAEPKPLH